MSRAPVVTHVIDLMTSPGPINLSSFDEDDKAIKPDICQLQTIVRPSSVSQHPSQRNSQGMIHSVSQEL